MANAALVRPCQRPARQNEAKTTTQCLWRAHMLKLRRAGMVSTKRLLAKASVLTPLFWRMLFGSREYLSEIHNSSPIEL